VVETLSKYLSPSTAKRRAPNIRTLLNIIIENSEKDALKFFSNIDWGIP
jgi:hypothetical protein